VNGTAEQQAQPAPLRDSLTWMFYRFEVSALAVWFVARWLVYGVGLRVPVEVPYVDGITLAVATLATLFGLSRWWPSQNVIAIAFLTIAFSGVLEHVLVISTGAAYPEIAGNALFGVAWSVPLLWLITLLNARSVARLILWPRREKGSYGLWLIVLTAVMTAIVLLVQEILSGRFVLWNTPVALCIVRFIAAVLLLAIVAPFLIPKGAVVPPPDYGPVSIWAILNIYLIIIAGIVQAWECAGVLVVMNGVLTTWALRARKKRRPKAPTQSM
jgi:hypothetical protein